MLIIALLLPDDPSMAVTLMRIQFMPVMSTTCSREWYVLFTTVASVTQPVAGGLPAPGPALPSIV